MAVPTVPSASGGDRRRRRSGRALRRGGGGIRRPRGGGGGRARAEPLGARHPAVSRVYTSPLRRARATAEAFAAHHHLPVGIRDDLIEIDFGAGGGLTLP